MIRILFRFAAQIRQGLCPFLIVDRFSCPEVDSQRSKVGCAGCLRRALEDIALPGDLEIDKTRGYHRSLKLCFQQSAGNSACPQIDITSGALGDRFLHQDVTNLQPPAGLEHPRHFLQGGWFIRNQIEDAVGDHHIRPAVLHG